MSRLQVLVASMHQNDFSKVETMNLSSDAIIANQADTYAYDEQDYSFGTVKMITTSQRGVGKNRNTSLNLADGDIVLIADDDIRYVDDYSSLILGEFERMPQADAIVFNITTLGESTYRRQNSVSPVFFLSEKSFPLPCPSSFPSLYSPSYSDLLKM